MRIVEFEGQKLSKLSFGTVQLGLGYGVSNTQGKPTQYAADEIINFLIKNGINCFDTAVAYGNSEEVLGTALRDNNTNIISKVKSDIFSNNLVETIYRSLKHLNQKKLYGLLLHDSKLLYEWKEEYTANITSLQEQKLINHFGVSIYTTQEFELAIKNPSIKIIQIPFNLFDQRAVNQKWFKKAKEAKKLIFIRSIFLQGLFFIDPNKLTGNLIEARPYLEQLHDMCKELNLSVSEFAMAYVDNIAVDSVLLFGCDSLKQAKENINSYNNLPGIEKKILDNINKYFAQIPEHITDPGQWNLS